ncbi:hypothetical protein CRG98_018469 [Punica granatum]|uniref:Uncharacterized protein n=1 Tax=Punica granatum TaxID=22663 RepID=A0A2I0JXU8_PUNGR|nr:hypothetical protein CRG98_018469 [Punica granatum]
MSSDQGWSTAWRRLCSCRRARGRTFGRLLHRYCVDPNFISSELACLHMITLLGSVHLPGGRMADACEKESSLPVYDPEIDGR